MILRCLLGHPARTFLAPSALGGGTSRPSGIPANPFPIVYLCPGIFFCTLIEHSFYFPDQRWFLRAGVRAF